jgi:hypothetical protein
MLLCVAAVERRREQISSTSACSRTAGGVSAKRPQIQASFSPPLKWNAELKLISPEVNAARRNAIARIVRLDGLFFLRAMPECALGPNSTLERRQWAMMSASTVGQEIIATRALHARRSDLTFGRQKSSEKSLL